MSKILAGIAALTIMSAAALPVQANAAEQKQGIQNGPSTEVSSQRHWRRHYGYRYYGPRRYWGPRYGYYGYPYPYYGYPYRPYYGPGVAFRLGPFGFGLF